MMYLTDAELVGELYKAMLGDLTYARLDALAAEARRRHVERDGHAPDCRANPLYHAAYRRYARGENRTPRPPARCTCGRTPHPA